MIRTALTAIVVLVMTFICGLLSIIFSFPNPYSRPIYYVAHLWSRSILFVAGTKVETEGLENIDPEKDYIFIGNHQSHFDVLAVFSVLPLTVRFLAKKELFKIPVFGWAIAAVGMIKIDRTNSEQSHRMLSKAQEIIKNGVSVVVFPEGTRSHDGEVKRFKKGGFVIAIKGDIPIIPVSISGSRFILQKHTLRITPGRIKLAFGPALETAEFTLENRDELVKITRDKIISNIDSRYNER